jgi:putative ABC transport system ATP-binding protein
MDTNIILNVEHLSKEFTSGDDTVHVLNDVSFGIEEGSTCAIVGPSGSGKTTLIAICAGLERPTKGSVLDGAYPYMRAREAGTDSQSVDRLYFQSFQLLPSLTALKNVMVPAEISGERWVRGGPGVVGPGRSKQSLYHYPPSLRR